ncbi:DinB family protein [Muriicola sp. Z0-33]|uniref:DinB family protein n=1 Tax=Muriicola sp. Z0-33 TaxID=2816957 RepID=UPI002238D9C9|nr:DinB family protein [Muriicola sp. Z0-33]MCW5515860.1 DUF664 domain-containing protein [Muriicola sp. Z0-33]
MKSISKIVITLIFSCSFAIANGQYEIKPAEGYTPQIGIMVDMLQDLKERLHQDVKELDLAQTDFLFDENANSIGAILMHIMATESYTMVETLEDRQWTEEEAAFWGVAGGLGAESRAQIKGKPITYYLDLWDELRAKTLEGLKKKDDAWFAANIDEGLNNHWAWFHILEHQAAHMGQVAIVKKRLPK